MKQETLERLSYAAGLLQGAISAAREDGQPVLESKDHIAVIRHYDNLRQANEIIKEARRALDEMSEQWSREYVPDAMRAKNVKTITLEGVGRVTISAKWSASIQDGKKPEAISWLKDGGNGSIVQETVNSSTLSAFAKAEFTEHGRELPVSLFKVGQMAYTSITRSK